MPPDALPPDDPGRTPPPGGNVSDPALLAERRAQRAEQAAREATRRAADAQSLAAELARERARIEAERDAARAEATAARESVQLVQAERDRLRLELERSVGERGAPAERDEPRGGAARSAPENGTGNGHRVGTAPWAWAADLRRELAVARAASTRPAATTVAPTPVGPSPALARERGLVARRAAEAPAPSPPAAPPPKTASLPEPAPSPPSAAPAASAPAAASEDPATPPADAAPSSEPPPPLAPSSPAAVPSGRAATEPPAPTLPPARAASPGDRATPVTALALERERSGRLQALLDRSSAAERELREQVAALERAIAERREAERRIETTLRRLRSEFDAAARVGDATPSAAAPAAPAAGAPTSSAPTSTAAASTALASTHAAPVEPEVPAGAERPAEGAPTPVAEQQRTEAAGLDAERLEQARTRLRAAATPEEPAAVAAATAATPAGPPAPWLPAVLRRLADEDPASAGRILVGMLPAQGLVTPRPLRYDLVLAGRGCVSVDVGAHGTAVTPRSAPRPRRDADLRIATDEAGLARLLLGRRGLRRRARVRGSRRRLRELRRLAREPLALRDLAGAGALADPALALELVAVAIDPVATVGHRFTIAHAPLAGGPADAWLRICDGAAPVALRTRPGEPAAATIRSTRGALVALLAGVAPLPGESAVVDGDAGALALVRAWIAATELPRA